VAVSRLDFAINATSAEESGRSGGHARAAALPPEVRSEIARAAASARWGKEFAIATHSGEIVIGDRRITCAVLEDGTRLINQETFLTALDRNPKAKGGTGSESSITPPFLAAANLKEYITPELRAKWAPVRYRPANGGVAWGYRAEILPEVCEVYLSASDDDVLLHNQEATALAANILMRGLARVGIVALVDEATGYQESRERRALQMILAEYVSEVLRPWVKTFPDEFFQQMFRLHGWDYDKKNSKRPGYAGKFINKYIYDQLPVGVHGELERLNPRNDSGNRPYRHHQLLTESTGVTSLDRQITAVTTLMRVARNKAHFEDLFEEAFPPMQPRLPLEIEA
jgi:hypothetical protein